MSSPDLESRLLNLHPVLAELPVAERQAVLAADVQHLQVPAGTVLFDEGSPCQGFPLLLAGNVRVARGSPGGRTLELYRVTPGEICVVSAACLFAQGGKATLSAHGQAAETTELLLLRPAGFERWCQQAVFRRHVFAVLAERLADLMALAEAVAFQRLDQRLAQALLGHGRALATTHQQLADSLGTVREIVSRLLARFEKAGWVRLSRERIEVLDVAALRQVASGERHA